MVDDAIDSSEKMEKCVNTEDDHFYQFP